MSSSSSRLFSFFSSKLSRQSSQISLASTITQGGENDSIMSSSSGSTKNWHYCNYCKIGFASKNRHDWHLDVCRSRSPSPSSVYEYDYALQKNNKAIRN